MSVRNLLIVISCICLTIVLTCIAKAQMGVPRGGAPLYSSKPYEPSAPTGLPAALKGGCIDQKLNEQLPFDAGFKDETGADVKLGSYFGKRPIVLSLVYFDRTMLCTQVLNGMIATF